MKVACLIPSFGEDFVKSARWFTRSRGRVQRHPDYFLTAVAVLERVGHEVLFIDAAAQNLSKLETIKKIMNYNPDMVVIFCTTPTIYDDSTYARYFKEFDIKVVLIGQHVTAVPPDGYLVIRGEYDYALLDVCNDKPIRKELADVNTLPFPAWHHINPYDYHDAGKLHPFITLISGRGCFGQCTFCVNTNLMYGRKLRMRRPEPVVDEMEYDLKMFPKLREIMFETDTFTADPAHVKGVCNEILRRKLDVTWSCNVRTDMDLSLLPLMKKAGCRMLMEGPESGSQKLLNNIRKGITVEQTKRLVKRANELGFIQHGCFMIGLPGETKETAKKTIELAKSLPFDTIQITGLVSYPGTPIYEWAKENGYLVPKDWNEFVSPEGEQSTVLNYPNFSKEDIDFYIDKGLKEFYFRPKQILRMALNIRNIGDIKRKLFGLKSFINYKRKVK